MCNLHPQDTRDDKRGVAHHCCLYTNTRYFHSPNHHLAHSILHNYENTLLLCLLSPPPKKSSVVSPIIRLINGYVLKMKQYLVPLLTTLHVRQQHWKNHILILNAKVISIILKDTSLRKAKILTTDSVQILTIT